MTLKKEPIWNVPNALTMVRMALIGVFIWQFVTGHRIWAMVIFLAAGATDVLDGYIARKYNLITDFGKLMDPLADKLMLVTALICLMTARLVPLWVVLTVILKESLMIAGGYWLLRRGVVVHSKMIGKLATAMFMVAVVGAFLHTYIAPWDFYLLVAATTLSVAAMVWYLVEAIGMLRHKPAVG